MQLKCRFQNANVERDTNTLEQSEYHQINASIVHHPDNVNIIVLIQTLQP